MLFSENQEQRLRELCGQIHQFYPQVEKLVHGLEAILRSVREPLISIVTSQGIKSADAESIVDRAFKDAVDLSNLMLFPHIEAFDCYIYMLLRCNIDDHLTSGDVNKQSLKSLLLTYGMPLAKLDDTQVERLMPIISRVLDDDEFVVVHAWCLQISPTVLCFTQDNFAKLFLYAVEMLVRNQDFLSEVRTLGIID